MDAHALADRAEALFYARMAARTAPPVHPVELTTFAALDAAADFGVVITEAGSLAELAAIQERLDEALGALLAQEQMLIRKREQLILHAQAR